MCDFSKYGIPSEEWVRLAATLPPPPTDLTIEQLKEVTNGARETAAEAGMKELSSKVLLQDYSIPTRDGQQLEARVYRPSARPRNETLPIYLHLHGGGFLFGTIKTEDVTCSKLAINAETVVLNVNYRHTPEHPYPTAWNDTEDALVWLCKNSSLFHGNLDKLVIGGVSAGGMLSTSVVQSALRSELELSPKPRILGQVLMIPVLVYEAFWESQIKQIKEPSLSSYQQNAEAPLLSVKTINFFNKLLKVENPDPNDRRFSPGLLTAEEAKYLPPTTFGLAGYDPLRDDGFLYAKLLTENGVPTNINVFKGVPHGFRRFDNSLSASKDYDRIMEEGIKWALTNPAATGQFVVNEY
ncbi:putative lipase [Talaromyces proteolyticus]|uniref:Lipase n=1 Tax=Talaromyces proteolyticus TaxID=1131652 RepID=A0AAD4KFF6_9EURO|nr:putative lipase [Talaromyces proteolyticus]KAH8690720.1 putative lipase [Talaromyces proteolyticus]